jgi:xylulokinase
LAHATESYPLQTPNPGWVEQDPQDYWTAICNATKTMTAASNADLKEIIGIAFTTQAQGVIPVDKEGTVLYPNITWVDGRAEEQAKKAMGLLAGKPFSK